MDISAVCSSCGHTVAAPEGFAGQEVDCPHCGDVIALPGGSFHPGELAQADVDLLARPARADPAVNRLAVRCDKCLQPYFVPRSVVGQRVTCLKCGHTFFVPEATLRAQGRESPTAQQAEGVDLLAPRAAEGKPLPKSRRRLAAGQAGRTNLARFVSDHAVPLAAALVGVVVWAIVLGYLAATW